MRGHSNVAWLGAGCVLASAVLFAIKAILIKLAYAQDPHLSGPVLLALRMASALPFFMLMAYVTHRQSTAPTRHDWGLLLLAGLLGYYLASVLDFIGLQYVSASLERIILFLYPTLTVLMTAVLQRQPIQVRTWLAIVLSYGGTLLVMLGEGTAALQANGVLYGSALVFAGAVAYAVYLVMTPTLIRRFGSWRFTGFAMSTACIAAIAHAVALCAGVGLGGGLGAVFYRAARDATHARHPTRRGGSSGHDQRRRSHFNRAVGGVVFG
jgi:drug/metabolite transporter (DMT)-like permease